MKITTFFRLLLLCGIFSTQTFFAAERPCLVDQARRFADDFEHKGTCVGACIDETDSRILRKMKRAESRFCTACYQCSCYTASFLAIGLVKYNLPPMSGEIIYGCTRVGIVTAAGKSMVGCCFSCNEVVKEGAYLNGLAHQSCEDRRIRRGREIDEALARHFQYLQQRIEMNPMPVQQIMGMDPTPVRRYSRDATSRDYAEDPTTLQ